MKIKKQKYENIRNFYFYLYMKISERLVQIIECLLILLNFSMRLNAYTKVNDKFRFFEQQLNTAGKL